MEPEVFLGFVSLITTGVLAVKYKAVRGMLLGGIAFALFFLIGWGLV